MALSKYLENVFCFSAYNLTDKLILCYSNLALFYKVHNLVG